jgi:hypothetical protein
VGPPTEGGLVIYLLHFSRPYRHARHYLGFTDNLEQRLAEHRSGRGSPLVAAAVRAGIDVVVAATWPGDRSVERRLHRYKNSRARLCPMCRAERNREAAAEGAQGSGGGDDWLVRVLAELGEPVTLGALQSHLRRRGHPSVGSLYGRLELLARAGLVRKGWLLGEIAWEAVPGS